MHLTAVCNTRVACEYGKYNQKSTPAGQSGNEEEDAMTTFDKREQGFESKFAYDQELRFKAEARRNRAVAEWAGTKLGLVGEALEAYTREIRKADLVEKGDEDVFRKVKADFAAKGIALGDTEIRAFMSEAFAKAVSDLESAKG
jgi:hypothetical protein